MVHSQRLWCSQWSRNRCFSGTLAFSMVQRMLAIWSLVPLPFLNPVWIWEFSVDVLLKPSLENFEHYFASMWNECTCVVVWTFFGTALLWDRNDNLFQSCGHCCFSQICWKFLKKKKKKKTVWKFLKKLKIAIGPNSFTPGYLSKKPPKHSYKKIQEQQQHFYNCQNKETSSGSINRWMDKEVYLYIRTHTVE